MFFANHSAGRLATGMQTGLFGSYGKIVKTGIIALITASVNARSLSPYKRHLLKVEVSWVSAAHSAKSNSRGEPRAKTL